MSGYTTTGIRINGKNLFLSTPFPNTPPSIQQTYLPQRYTPVYTRTKAGTIYDVRATYPKDHILLRTPEPKPQETPIQEDPNRGFLPEGYVDLTPYVVEDAWVVYAFVPTWIWYSDVMTRLVCSFIPAYMFFEDAKKVRYNITSVLFLLTLLLHYLVPGFWSVLGMVGALYVCSYSWSGFALFSLGMFLYWPSNTTVFALVVAGWRADRRMGMVFALGVVGLVVFAWLEWMRERREWEADFQRRFEQRFEVYGEK